MSMRDNIRLRGAGGRGGDGKDSVRIASTSSGTPGAVAGGGGDNGEGMEAMEVDTGEEGHGAFRQENGDTGHAGPSGFGLGSGLSKAANGDSGSKRSHDDLAFGVDEIPAGDVAVLSNHRSEVSCLWCVLCWQWVWWGRSTRG